MKIFQANIIGNSNLLSGSLGKLNSSSFTGSFQGTASYALTASYAMNGGGGGTITIADEGTSQGTATFINFIGDGVTATVSSNTASITINGGLNATASFTNQSTWTFNHNLGTQTVIVQAVDTNFNQLIPASITLTSANVATLTFPSNVSGYAIASLGGANSTTASYALSSSYAITSSYALTAQTLLGSVESASYASTASYVILSQTASYVTTAQTASYILNAQTASYVTTAQTASYVLQAVSASYASTASYILQAVSSSYSITSSYALTAQTLLGNVTSASYAETASYVVLSQTASYVTTAQTASYILNAVSASYAATASYVLNAQTASFVTLAQTASYVETAQTASYVLNAVSASYASTASYVSGIRTKSNQVAGGSFAGNPKKTTVTFTTPFANNNYSITVTGEDLRSWTIESKVSGSFIINSNSNTAFAGNVFWIAISHGEFLG